MKRVLVYMIYDKNGVVDDYIFYQLNSFKKHVDYICCVINGFINESSLNRLKNKYADRIIIRKNEGVDIGAYKNAISELGWDFIKRHDELILMNYTCFGPIFPLDYLFNWAEKQECDLWGLTLGRKLEGIGNSRHRNKDKLHIQSYFVCYRKSLFENDVLKRFFDRISNDCSYWESTNKYEYALPEYFEKRNFKASVFCDDFKDFNYALLHNPVNLIKKYKMPFVKKRVFFHNYSDYLLNGAGESSKNLIDFVLSDTKYNVKYIYDSILRTCNLADVVRDAHLNRVISSTSCDKDFHIKSKTGIIYLIYHNDALDQVLDYLKRVPKCIDILILLYNSTDIRKANLLYKCIDNNLTIKKIQNKGRDASALLIESYDFVLSHDLLCFLHDIRHTKSTIYSVERSWNYKLAENCLCNETYITNIVSMFEKESQLGIAFPAYPNHGPFSISFNSWASNYKNTKKLLNKLKIEVPLDKQEMAIAPLGTCFWFRKDALINLFQINKKQRWDYSDFPKEPIKRDGTLLHAIERSYAYICQGNGYYPAFLYNTTYLPIELTNLEFQLSCNDQVRKYDSTKFSHTKIKVYERNKYGIKQSIIFLYDAICSRFHFVKYLLFPLRWIKRKIRR